MNVVDMLEAKSSLSRLVEDIELGREREIIIARRGRPVAKLVPVDVEVSRRPRLGVAKGQFEVPDSIDEMNHEVAKLIVAGV